MTDSAHSTDGIEQVTRWKVRCYSCGWLPTVASKAKARAEKRRHERDCGTAEVKRVRATLDQEELWSDTTATDLGITEDDRDE